MRHDIIIIPFIRNQSSSYIWRTVTQNNHMCTKYFYVWIFTNFNCNVIIFIIFQYFNEILAQFRKKIDRHIFTDYRDYSFIFLKKYKGRENKIPKKSE